MYCKTEIDDECESCKAYHYTPKHISMDAYNDHDEECDCDFDWECPYRECDDDCEQCDVADTCEHYNGDLDD
jgi:hypothetical protein